MAHIRHFAYEHLPPHLQEVSKPFHDLAESLIAKLPDCDQRSVSLQRLLEAKDAAVRAEVMGDL